MFANVQSHQLTRQSIKESRTYIDLVKSLIFSFKVQISDFRVLFSLNSFKFSNSLCCSFEQSQFVNINWQLSYYVILLLRQINDILSTLLCYINNINIIMQAKGPGSRNINYYLQNSPQISPSRVQQSASNNESLQQQFDKFVKQVNQYDIILSGLANNSEEKIGEKYFITDFYPEFILNCSYEQDEQKKTMASSNLEMMKTMGNIQKINKRMKQQLKGWYFQYGKKTRYTQTLLQQNKVLRSFVSKKNKQIVKIIQSISRSSTSEFENTQRNKLIQILDELKQENAMMMQHVKNLKSRVKDRSNQQTHLNEGLKKLLLDKSILQNRRVQYQDKEEHSSKQITIKKDNQKEYLQRQQYLIKQRDRLIKLKQQFQIDNAQIEKQIQRCKIDKIELEGWLKKQFSSHQSKKQEIYEQIEEYSQRYNNLKKMNDEKMQEIDKNENKIANYTKTNESLDKKIAQAQLALKSKQKQLAEVVDTEVSVLSAIDLLGIQIAEIRDQLEEKRKLEQKDKQKLENKIKQTQKMGEDDIRRWQKQLQMSRKQANRKILEQKNIIEFKRKEIQHVQSDISNSNAYIQSLLNQLRQIKSKESGPITKFYAA